MSFSPNSSKVAEAVEMNYTDMKRSSSLRWISVNIVLFLVFAYDLWCKCPGYTSALHYVELAGAGVLAANTLQHARRLARRAPGPPAPRAPARASPAPPARASPLSARASSSPPPSPPSAAPPAPAPDRFIADQATLAEYLRGASPPPEEWVGAGAPGLRPHYQLASLDTERGAVEGGSPAAGVWRRLSVPPARLAQWTLNLRLWLSATLLERLARALDEADAQPEGPAPSRLEPYLRPFADRRYVARRVRELAAGGCLGAYRWCGGGADWSPALPSDAELLLHLFLAYLEAMAPGGEPELRLETRRPPHAVVWWRGARLEAARGRDNALHSLLLLLAGAARSVPPALRRLHLGPAGLNMLWIIADPAPA